MTNTGSAEILGQTPDPATTGIPLVIVARENDAATLATWAAGIAQARHTNLVHVLYLHPLPRLAAWDPNLLTGVWEAMEAPALRVRNEIAKSLQASSIDTRFFCYPGSSVYRVVDHVSRHPISDLIFAEHDTTGWRRLQNLGSTDLNKQKLQETIPTITLCQVPIRRCLRGVK